MRRPGTRSSSRARAARRRRPRTTPAPGGRAPRAGRATTVPTGRAPPSRWRPIARACPAASRPTPRRRECCVQYVNAHEQAPMSAQMVWRIAPYRVLPGRSRSQPPDEETDRRGHPDERRRITGGTGASLTRTALARLGPQQGEQDDVADDARFGSGHGQPIYSQTEAGRRRHPRAPAPDVVLGRSPWRPRRRGPSSRPGRGSGRPGRPGRFSSLKALHSSRP